MKHLLLLLSAAALAACTPAGIFSAAPVEETYVDGTRMLVQKMAATDSAFGAQRADIMTHTLVNSDYLLNVRAIEQHTGCAVIRETIVHMGAVTQAAVDCTHRK